MRYRGFAGVLAIVLVIAMPLAGAAAATRRAFVIGISHYSPITALTTPAADAARVGAKLGLLGFTVTLVTDPDTTRAALALKWGEFLADVDQGDEVVVYYAGHGVEIGGANYLVPSDAPKADAVKLEASLKLFLFPLDDWIADLTDRQVAVGVWILDACRDNPFALPTRSLGGKQGLDTSRNPLGVFIFYAAAAHETALDHRPEEAAGSSSIFTRVFLNMFDAYKNKPLRDFGADIKRPVEALADPHPQHPWYTDGLDDPWCFGGCASTPPHIQLMSGDGKLITVASLDDALYVRGLPLLRSQPGSAAAQNAIFLGKASNLPKAAGAAGCASQVSDALPFGCRFLLQVASSQTSGQAGKLLRVPLHPQTKVAVRKRIPAVDQKAQGQSSCVVVTLTPRDSVRFAGIVSISYDDDQYYWGLVDWLPLDCMSR